MDTVFRFITVRGPQKPTDEILDRHFVRYEEAVGAKLVEEVAGVVRDNGGRARVEAVIQKFAAGEGYASDVFALRKLAPGLVELGEWLSRERSSVTRAAYDDWMQKRKVEAKPPALQALWNNLLAYSYGGGAPEVREAAISGLRAARVVSLPEDRLDDALLRALAAAVVVLPSRVHTSLADPPPQRSEPGTPPPAHRGEKPEAPVLGTRLVQLQTAAEELTRYHRTELAKIRSAPVPAPKLPRHCADRIEFPEEEPGGDKGDRRSRLVLNGQILSRLSKDSRLVLQELNVDDEVDVAYALRAIEEEAARLGKQAGTVTRPVQKVVQAGGAFWTEGTPHASPPPRLTTHLKHTDHEYKDFHKSKPECRVKPLGIADFRRVEQEIWCYQPGEVAHLENVLQGESKERTTRRLRRSEETVFVSREDERTEEREAETTERFELEREASKVVEDQLKFELGVQVAGSYGAVRVTADTKFAVSNSTTESDKSAARHAREVTDRALERIVQKVKEERTTKLIEEYEETSKHGINNAEGEGHVVGLYRWVNKIYRARVVNYGKRLMFEFTLPEPAAFHLFATTAEPIESTLQLERPLDPRSAEAGAKLALPPLLDHTRVTPTNYALWGAAYGATIEPPPPAVITTGKAYHAMGLESGEFAESKTDLMVPAGYEAGSARVHWGFHASGDNWMTVFVGRWGHFSRSGQNTAIHVPLHGEDDIVPVNVMGKGTFWTLNVEVDCLRTTEALDQWKIKTFAAIMKSYGELLTRYETALTSAKAHASVIQFRGNNPLRNRELEKLELKKGAIRLLAQNCRPLWSDAMRDDQECHYPEFDCCEAIRDGAYVQFVEQAFEWSLMTYLFYPYFWGRKCNWSKIYQLDDVDPLFLAFLQAGYSRVIVPVREGYEEAAMRFLADGTLFNGGGVPGIDSELYLSMVAEMKEPVGEVDPAVEPWNITVPTSLTVLQCESGCVEGTGLPCPGLEEEG